MSTPSAEVGSTEPWSSTSRHVARWTCCRTARPTPGSLAGEAARVRDHLPRPRHLLRRRRHPRRPAGPPDRRPVVPVAQPWARPPRRASTGIVASCGPSRHRRPSVRRVRPRRHRRPGRRATSAACTVTRDAVIAGLSQPWNSGVVEGRVNRIKLLKRQMFGRAGFERRYRVPVALGPALPVPSAASGGQSVGRGVVTSCRGAGPDDRRAPLRPRSWLTAARLNNGVVAVAGRSH